MERAAGITSVESIAQNTFFRNCINDAEAALAAGAPEARKASPLVVQVLASLELFVLAEDRPRYQRFIAWAKVINVWASLRADDTRGCRPSLL
eukprot:15453849-Alexandrium_andersonii.AAC.1